MGGNGICRARSTLCHLQPPSFVRGDFNCLHSFLSEEFSGALWIVIFAQILGAAGEEQRGRCGGSLWWVFVGQRGRKPADRLGVVSPANEVRIRGGVGEGGC